MQQLTWREASAVAELIEENLIDIIRNDPSIDNIDWVTDILSAYKKLITIVPEPTDRNRIEDSISNEDTDW